MDLMDDDSWQQGFSVLEDNDWNIFSDFDMNSVGEKIQGDSSVDHAEVSGKESTTTLLSNFSSLEENTGFDMPILRQNASPQLPKSFVLSFEGSTSVATVDKKTCQHLGEHSKQTKEEKPHNRKPLKRGRTSSQTVDHIIAERKRRENITTLFIALSALIPGLKKMDKVSVLNNAIEYVKNLQQRVKDLEKENQKRKIESVGCLKLSKTKNMVAYDLLSWTSQAYDGDKATKKCSKVEARVAGKNVLIRVLCEMQKNIVQNVMAKLEAHNLSLICSNVLPFGNSTLAITSISEMNPKFAVGVDDLVKTLTEDLSKL